MRLVLLTVLVVSVFGKEKKLLPKKDGSKKGTHGKPKLKGPRNHDYYESTYEDYYDYYEVMRFKEIGVKST